MAPFLFVILEVVVADMAGGRRHVAVRLARHGNAPYRAIARDFVNAARPRAGRRRDLPLEIADVGRTGI